MSLYREPGRRSRTTWIVALLAGAVLLAIGFGIGRASAPEPSLETQIADVRTDAARAADALELVSIHYGGTNATTREAAQQQLNRAEALFADLEPRATLVDPVGTREARAALVSLGALVSAGAAPERVEQAALNAENAVRGAGS